MFILLYSGLMAGMFVATDYEGDQFASISEENYGVYATSPRVTSNFLRIQFKDEIPEIGTGTGTVDFDGSIRKWRTVSRGARIQLINTSDTDQGYFQAIRMVAGHTQNAMAICGSGQFANGNGDGSDNDYMESEAPRGNEVFFLGGFPFNSSISDGQGWPELGSYMSGALKDIHKFQFNLRHLTDNHKWMECKKTSSVNELDYHVDDGQLGCFRGPESNRGDPGWNSMYDQYIDQDMDMIAIRIKGASPKAQIKIDTSTNMEMIYTLGAPEAKFMRPVPGKSTAHENVQNHQAKSKQAAGDPRPVTDNLNVSDMLPETVVSTASDAAKALQEIVNNIKPDPAPVSSIDFGMDPVLSVPEEAMFPAGPNPVPFRTTGLDLDRMIGLASEGFTTTVQRQRIGDPRYRRRRGPMGPYIERVDPKQRKSRKYLAPNDPLKLLTQG